MDTNTKRNLSRWIKGHGAETRNADDPRKPLAIGIRWVNPQTGASGVDWSIVRSVADARAKLGY